MNETQDDVALHLAGLLSENHTQCVIAEFQRLLAILGSIDSDEVVALALLAEYNVSRTVVVG